MYILYKNIGWRYSRPARVNKLSRAYRWTNWEIKARLSRRTNDIATCLADTFANRGATVSRAKRAFLRPGENSFAREFTEKRCLDAIGTTYRRHGVRVCASDGDSATQLVERESRLPLDDDPPRLFIVALLRLNCYSVLAPRDARHARARTHAHVRRARARSPHRSIDTIWTVDTYATQIIFITTLFIHTRYFCHSYCYVKEKYVRTR